MDASRPVRYHTRVISMQTLKFFANTATVTPGKGSMDRKTMNKGPGNNAMYFFSYIMNFSTRRLALQSKNAGSSDRLRYLGVRIPPRKPSKASLKKSCEAALPVISLIFLILVLAGFQGCTPEKNESRTLDPGSVAVLLDESWRAIRPDLALSLDRLARGEAGKKMANRDFPGSPGKPRTGIFGKPAASSATGMQNNALKNGLAVLEGLERKPQVLVLSPLAATIPNPGAGMRIIAGQEPDWMQTEGMISVKPDRSDSWKKAGLAAARYTGATSNRVQSIRKTEIGSGASKKIAIIFVRTADRPEILLDSFHQGVLAGEKARAGETGSKQTAPDKTLSTSTTFSSGTGEPTVRGGLPQGKSLIEDAAGIPDTLETALGSGLSALLPGQAEYAARYPELYVEELAAAGSSNPSRPEPDFIDTEGQTLQAANRAKAAGAEFIFFACGRSQAATAFAKENPDIVVGFDGAGFPEEAKLQGIAFAITVDSTTWARLVGKTVGLALRNPGKVKDVTFATRLVPGKNIPAGTASWQFRKWL